VDKNFNTGTIDDRGWYITNYYGKIYLQKDGSISNGVNGPSGGFWKTKKKAKKFLKKWLKRYE